MILFIENVLSAAECVAACAALAEAGTFAPGARTAGWHAKAVKANEQASGPVADALTEKVSAALLAHPVFRAAAQPKRLVRLLVSRYGPGMAYGTHVDDAVMDGVRTDLSFTLFLAPPGSYDGGELVMEGYEGDTPVKLPAGSLVLYETSALHRVAEVTCGARLAVVGWVRSYVRDPSARELLFDLDNLVAALRQSNAERSLIDRAIKVRSGLMRRWAED